MATEADAQATEYVSTGPWALWRMATCEACAFGMKAGMVSGGARPPVLR